MIDSSLSHYRITARLGAGGMGEVYRAQDTSLGRDVALKLLPPDFAADPDRLARFEREARLLASLNHPNIAHVYGFEAATLPDGSPAHLLAMELVEGEDLSERLRRGPIPVDEAIEIARQIAEALEEAHEKGIVHRDLKPANVKVTPDGKVKVLDFGLAKAWAGEPPPGSGADLSQSPTLAHAGTQAGVILGTAAYMSPEQARGKAVDRRADVWAFGVVLFEMLTARPLFGGETVSDVLAAVLTRDPGWSALPARTPTPIVRLLRRCLERDPRKRLRDVGEARCAIEAWQAGGGDETAAGPASPPERSRSPWAWSAAALVLGVVATLAGVRGLRPRATPPQPTVVPVDLGAEALLMQFGASSVLSPDGRRMAWVSGTKSRSHITVRELGQPGSRVLGGTEDAHDPVFSPDGREIAFFAEGGLRKVPFAGGAAVQLAETGDPRGVTWGDGGFLVYNRDINDGLFRVAEQGSEAKRLTTPDRAAGERSHRWPWLLPGSKQVLFLSQGLGQTYEEATIELLDLDSGKRSVVRRGGSYPRLASTGDLLFVRNRAVWAGHLQLSPPGLEGEPVQVLDQVAYATWSGGAQFSVASNGALLYSTGSSSEAVRVVRLDPASGRSDVLLDEPGFYYGPELSPDGRQLAFQVYTGASADVWVLDVATGEKRRLTFGGRDQDPAWSADGRSIVFAAMTERSVPNLFRVRADGGGRPQPLTESGSIQVPSSISPQGILLFTEQDPTTRDDIWSIRLDVPGAKPEPFLVTPARERGARVSADGRWMAYESDESGRTEVYVRAFAGTAGGGGRWQISDNGGELPRWGRDGRSLFYSSNEALFERELRVEASAIIPGAVRPVDESRFPALSVRLVGSGFAVDAKGRLIVLSQVTQDRPRTETVLVLDWATELARRLSGAGN